MLFLEKNFNIELITLPSVEGYAPSNTSVVNYNDELVFQTRYVSYSKHFTSNRFNPFDLPLNQNYIFNGSCYESRNFRYHGDKFEEVDYYKNVDYLCMFKGLEDARFVIWDEELYVYGTRCDLIKDRSCIVIYTPEGEEIIAKSPYSRSIEKNWMAIPDKPFTFVYGFIDGDTIIVKVERDGDCRVAYSIDNKNNRDLLHGVRGGTPLMKVSDGYIAVVHKQICDNNSYSYRHAFVHFDEELRVKKVSKWFIFINDVCEFCTGLTMKGDKVYITFSILDCVPYLMTVGLEDLMYYIYNRTTKDNEYVFDNKYYIDLIDILQKLRQYKSVSIIANYVLTHNYISALLPLYLEEMDLKMFLKIKYLKHD